MSITENIQTHLNEKKYCVGVFVDLRKAFDTVDHNILLRKLDYCGIRGMANEWFCSYLKKRKQFVSIENNMSSVKEILTGVPQGSVLGPLLFLIYINDLHKSIRFSKTYRFADDTELRCRGLVVSASGCRGVLVAESPSRSFLVLESQCRSICASTVSFSFSLNLLCHIIHVDIVN